MGLSKLNKRDAVLKAIREFGKIGREKFLKKYGFRRARNYFLIYDGKYYDSKAIVGAALGFQIGKPLQSKDFSGGNLTVRPKLESLKFSVVANPIDESYSALPEEVLSDLFEGGKRTITINSYERNPSARAACISHYGTKCQICQFDFGDFYGEEFSGHIHVHHTKPISKVKRKYKVDPIKDLIPVCPNCHAAIHYGTKARSIPTVKRLLQKNKKPPHVLA